MKARSGLATLLGLTCAAAAMAAPAGATAAGPSIDSGVERVLPSIVSVLQETTGTIVDAQGNAHGPYDIVYAGTGFFISSDGYLVTAGHVAAPTSEELHLELANSYVDEKFNCDPFSAGDRCRSVEDAHADQAVIDTTTRNVSTTLHVVTQDMDPNGDGLAATLVASSPSTDLDTAVLKVQGMNEPVALLGAPDAAQPSLTIAVIGYPASSEDGPSGPTMVPTTTRGQVTELLPPDVSSPNAGAANLLQVDAHVEQGNSGGPAVDSNGAVVGIVSFGNLHNVNYLISIADVRSVVGQTHARNQLGSIDNLWRAGLDAAARGNSKQAATDFEQCSSLNPAQIYCRAHAAQRLASGEPGAGAAPEALGQSAPTHAHSNINAIAVQRLALLVALVVASGVALTHRRARRRDARDKPSS